MFLKLPTLFLLLISLSACATQPTTLPPTSTPLPTTTPTLSQTATPRPSATTTPRPTRTRTLTPTITIDTTITAIVENLVATVQPRRTTFLSPDGQWRAEVLIYECTQILPVDPNAYDMLQLVYLPDGNVHKVDDQLQYCGGIGAYGLGGITWSPNSRYFYFTDAREGIPDGSGGYGWHRPVWRVDTTTLQNEDVTGPFSPDKQKIVSMQYQPGKWCQPEALVVETLDGDVLARYPIEPFEGTCLSRYFAWSPNSQELVYLETPCVTIPCQSTLYHIDLSTADRQTLFADHEPGFVEVAWPEPDILTLSDENYMLWNYTVSTGQLEQQQE